MAKTDHKALIHLQQQPYLSSRQVGWVAKLQEFDIRIEYIPGQLNNLADILSRSPDFIPRCGVCKVNRAEVAAEAETSVSESSLTALRNDDIKHPNALLAVSKVIGTEGCDDRLTGGSLSCPYMRRASLLSTDLQDHSAGNSDLPIRHITDPHEEGVTQASASLVSSEVISCWKAGLGTADGCLTEHVVGEAQPFIQVAAAVPEKKIPKENDAFGKLRESSRS